MYWLLDNCEAEWDRLENILGAMRRDLGEGGALEDICPVWLVMSPGRYRVRPRSVDASIRGLDWQQDTWSRIATVRDKTWSSDQELFMDLYRLTGVAPDLLWGKLQIWHVGPDSEGTINVSLREVFMTESDGA
jgi:hypothetical protein